jgi:putative methyltransferase
VIRHIWETTRGCPFECTFCDWGSYTHQKIRKFDDARLEAEIQWITENVEELLIADANFGILPRDVKLVSQIIEGNKKSNRLKAVLLAFTKNTTPRAIEIGEMLFKANLLRTGVTLSVQSHTPEVINNIKRQNIKAENFSKFQKLCNEKNVYHYTELILPLPGETKQSFLKSLEVTLEGKPSEIRVWPLQLYPNAEISDLKTREKFDFEIEEFPISKGHDTDENETVEVVISTNTLSRDEFNFLKRMSELVDITYMGKWFLYIIDYLKQEHGLARTQFYDSLLNRSKYTPGSPLNKFLHNGYLDEYNQGETSKFVGPFSPYNVSWEGRHFNKNTFHWLCFSVDRKQLFSEVEAFLKECQIGDPDIMQDLIAFQNWMIFDLDNYNPHHGKIGEFKMNWPGYFFRNQKLEKNAQKYQVEDCFVGDGPLRRPIDFNDPDCVFLASGGDTFYRRKSNVCQHSPGLVTKIVN